MSENLDLPLPELTCSTRDNFSRAWTRFEFVAAAKNWDIDRQLAVIPTLLRDRLVDFYVDCDDEET